MPQYAVAHEAMHSSSFLPRKKRDPNPVSKLPTSKVPAAVAVAPPASTYNVIPQAPAAPATAAPVPAPTAPLAMQAMDRLKSPEEEQYDQPPVETPTLAQPEEADDPATAGLKRAAENLRTAQEAPVKKTSRGKAFLQMAVQALAQSRPGKDWTDVAMQAGQALGGGLGGAIEPSAPGAIQKQYNVQKAEGELATQEKLANTMSLTDRRADQTRLSGMSLAQRTKAADMNQKYKEYLMREGKRRNDSIIERQKFLTEHAKDVFADKQTQEAWVREFGERKLSENIRQFNSKDEIARAQLVVNQKRAASYEASVKNGITGKQAELAADAAEGQALLDVADEYDTAIQGLVEADPDGNYDEILALRRAKVSAQKQGRAKLAGAQAGAAARGVAPINQTVTMPTTNAGLNIEGAIAHFRTVNKRAPTKTEIANMKAALGH